MPCIIDFISFLSIIFVLLCLVLSLSSEDVLLSDVSNKFSEEDA